MLISLPIPLGLSISTLPFFLRHGTVVDLPCRVESHILPPGASQVPQGVQGWKGGGEKVDTVG